MNCSGTGIREPGTGWRMGMGVGAFEAMHRQLDCVWEACWRVLRDGGIACVNIGDAVRTVGGDFQLYPNPREGSQRGAKGWILTPACDSLAEADECAHEIYGVRDVAWRCIRDPGARVYP